MPRKKTMTKAEAKAALQGLKDKLVNGEIKFEKYAKEKHKLKPFICQKE